MLTDQQVRDLLHRAADTIIVSPGPPAPSARQRRWRLGANSAATAAAVAAAAAVVVVVVGIGITTQPTTPTTDRSTATDGSSVRVDDIDRPTALSDVTDAAFTTPGEPALRNIRVRTFLRSWAITRCGGRGEPIDSTAGRSEQNLLPNLDLIREKGFTEPTRESFAGTRHGCDGTAELEKAVPTFATWSALGGEWHETVDATLSAPSLTSLVPQTAKCLDANTARTIGERDPINSFFDNEDSDGISHSDATAYARCTTRYFTELEALLMSQRPAFIDANKEVLQQFASELVVLGYVP